ncbi:MAG TPA: hypothetical protein DCG69_02645 [Bacteroidales bacterium]|nr:hypothetical protein [Bacteroidales bacterium]
MKKQLLLLFIGVISIPVFGQIGGLSASKIGAVCTTPVAENKIEFEPFFAYALSNHYFDSNSNRQDLFSTADSTLKFSTSGFRFTYGLFKNFEIGVTLPVDVSEVRFGAKYKLPFEGSLSMGILGGYNTLVGNQVYARRNSAHEMTPSFVGGLIFTYKINEKMCFDFDAQFQKHTEETIAGHTHGVFLDSAIGYYILENVNFLAALSYNYKFYSNPTDDSYLLTLNTGIAIEKAEHFILVINAPFDLLGKNEYQTKGFGLALTILLD